jgi:hypothetical protein
MLLLLLLLLCLQLLQATPKHEWVKYAQAHSKQTFDRSPRSKLSAAMRCQGAYASNS